MLSRERPASTRSLRLGRSHGLKQMPVSESPRRSRRWRALSPKLRVSHLPLTTLTRPGTLQASVETPKVPGGVAVLLDLHIAHPVVGDPLAPWVLPLPVLTHSALPHSALLHLGHLTVDAAGEEVVAHADLVDTDTTMARRRLETFPLVLHRLDLASFRPDPRPTAPAFHRTPIIITTTVLAHPIPIAPGS